jgi:YesN/AraC family two-component response regulator
MNRQVGDGCSPDVAYAKKKGNALLSYLLDCVRRGNYSGIEAALSDPAYLCLTQVIICNDFSYAHTVFQFLSPQIVRASVEGGMSEMAAAGTYLNYIKKAHQARSVRTLWELHKGMLLEYAKNVAKVQEDYHFSPLVRQCRSYIREHLHQPLFVYDIAEALHVSRSYLSRVYKRETGETISRFIRHEKVSEAKILLRHTSFSVADIGQQLGYCSQSHFTDVFRKETGMTPNRFRKKYIRQEPVRDKK